MYTWTHPVIVNDISRVRGTLGINGTNAFGGLIWGSRTVCLNVFLAVIIETLIDENPFDIVFQLANLEAAGFEVM